MLIKLRFRFPDVFFGALLAVAIFALGAAFWSAQNPSQPTQPQSTANGTNEKNQRQQHEGLWDWITHDAAGFFTLWLVGGGQLALFYVQLRIIRKSLDDAKIAADAAKDAANAAKDQVKLARTEFIATHRPRLIVHEVYIDGGRIWFRLANIGSTKATIVESWAMTENVQGALRSLLSTGYDQYGRLDIAGGVSVDLPYDPPQDHAFILKVGQRPNVVAPLHFTGTIVYVDELETRRRSVFRRLWHNGKRSFVRLDAEEERDSEYAD
jgi:hypothetical protein